MAKSRARAAEEETPQIPDLEDEKNPRVHTAAVRYWDRMQERKAAGDEEVAAHASLVEVMAAEGITSYRYKDVEVHLDTKTKARVTRSTPGGEDDE